MDRYIPALSYKWLTPAYDLFMRWGMREAFVKRRLIEQAQIRTGMNLLDLGCGTGTMTVLIKQMYTDDTITGLDVDPDVVEIANLKATRAGVTISLGLGMAEHLPYSDQSFDRVMSSFMFHHLNTVQKDNCLREVWRVLKDSGELHLLDFGRPRSLYARVISLVMRRLEETEDNIHGLLTGMMKDAGFAYVEEKQQFDTFFGGLSLYKAIKQ